MARDNKRKDAKDDSEEAVEALVRDEPKKIDPLEDRIDEEALILPHCARFVSAERPTYFVLKEFALITGLNCGRYPRDSRYVKAMEGEAFFKNIEAGQEGQVQILLGLVRALHIACTGLVKNRGHRHHKMVDNLDFFEKYLWGKESFSLTLDYLKKQIDFSRQKKIFETKGVSSYALYGFSWAFMIWIYEAFSALGRGNSKSTEDPLPIPRLLRWHTSKGDKLIEGDLYLNGWSTKRVHPYLNPTVREMNQHYMKKFKAFTDEPNDTFIDGLKACLEGVTVITSSEDGEDGDDDQNLGENIVSKHVTRGAGTSKPRLSGKTPMIENLEERVFRLEESIKDIADFIKEERMMRAEKERQKKRDEAEGVQVQSRHLAVRAGCDDSGIKEALLEVAALEHTSINADEVMIPEVATVVEKENMDEEENKADGSSGVEKEDHDEGGQDEDNKNEKNDYEEENNEGYGEETEEKNAQEVEKEQHKEEEKSDAPKKEGIAEKGNENEFPNLDEFLNEVSQEIDKMMVEIKNVESLDNY
ncbi:uncharacterized protein LOC107873954 [Capsicum annuum]|uniref:uncharacterized protein LOC107873954 n=1 Tax=Capsicum annuum TaxID=4072 RepID=UPI0007BF2CB3|nr:uncharacterized protein LOC107873954 [Capsicum annuum]